MGEIHVYIAHTHKSDYGYAIGITVNKMNKKIFMGGFVVMLVLSGLLVAVGGEAMSSCEVSAKTDEKLMQTSISDWHDLHNIRNDLEGYYVLSNDLTPDTAGYLDYNDSATAGWLPVGAGIWGEIDFYYFTGSFDGRGIR